MFADTVIAKYLSFCLHWKRKLTRNTKNLDAVMTIHWIGRSLKIMYIYNMEVQSSLKWFLASTMS